MICDAETPRAGAGDRGDPRRPARGHPRRGEARADAVGARGRDPALRGHRRGGGPASRSCAAAVREVAARNGLAIGAAGTHPSALYEDQLIVDRPRYKELAAELGWIARAGADLRHPRPRRHRRRRRRRSTSPTGCAATCRCCSACPRTRPLWQGRTDRDDVLAHAGLPRLPAGRDPAVLRELGDLLPPRRADDARRRDPRLHLSLVGRAPAPEPRHRRAPRLRPADEDRAHDRLRRARPGARPPARAATTTTGCRASSTRTS